MHRRGAVALLTGITLLALCVVAERAPSVLFRWHDRTAVDPGADLFVVLNPARDRGPELVAHRLLSTLQSGRCDAALVFVDPDRRRELCTREASYKALTWKLRDREERPDATRLFFAVYRAPLPPSPSNVWITVRRTPGGWEAVEYECWY